MKKLLFIIFILLVISVVLSITGSVIACDGHGHDTTKGDQKTDTLDTIKKYPLDVCIVSGAKLGSMGVPVTFNFKGQEYKVCCEGCVSAIKRNQEKYLKKIEDAKAKKNKEKTE